MDEQDKKNYPVHPVHPVKKIPELLRSVAWQAGTKGSLKNKFAELTLRFRSDLVATIE